MITYDICKAIIFIAFTFIIYLKISNLTALFYLKLINGITYVISFSYFTLQISLYIKEPYKSILVVLFSSFYFMILTKKSFKNVVNNIIISYTISQILFLLTSIGSAIIIILTYLFKGGSIEEIIFNKFDIINKILWKATILALIIEIFIIVVLMKTNVIISESQKKLVGSIGITLSGIVIIFYGFSRQNVLSNESWLLFITGIILCALGLIYCFKKETIITYNEKVSEVTIKRLKQEVKETQEINDYLEYNAHNDTKRLPAYRKAVEELINSTDNLESKKKALNLLNELREAEHEQTHRISDRLDARKNLPSTDMILVDALFSHMYDKASHKNIEFDLIVGNSINEITRIITQFQLETLCADLIENAIIATDNSNDGFKHITVYLWKSSGKYELRIDDNGIPFEIDTFKQLGKRRITTHGNSGGSGIGFMTIFEIINICNASLIIAETPLGYSASTKSITIRFDGNSERIIYSYRAREIIKECNNGSWIIRDYFNEQILI